MKHENQEKLRKLLIGKKISNVVFHESHGPIIDLHLHNGTTMITNCITLSICTYDPQDIREGKHFMDELQIRVNEEEL